MFFFTLPMPHLTTPAAAAGDDAPPARVHALDLADAAIVQCPLCDGLSFTSPCAPCSRRPRALPAAIHAQRVNASDLRP